MASRSTVLIAKDISKSYGDRIIIDHLSLTVHEGEAVALTGRNGAGKSTVLRMLVGADRPSSGTIEVLGKKVSETNPEFRRNVATVIDDLDFFPDLSVVEHLDLLARAHGLVDADALTRCSRKSSSSHSPASFPALSPPVSGADWAWQRPSCGPANSSGGRADVRRPDRRRIRRGGER